MRLIGKFPHMMHARTFSDCLTHAGIESQVTEEVEDGIWLYEIWVVSEDDVKQAEELFNTFIKDPDAEEYKEISKSARKIKKKAEKEAQKKAMYIDARTTVFYRGQTPHGALTLLLILACLAVAVFSRLGQNAGALRMLFITDIIRNGWLPEIMRGEIWRLFTPIFIHFGLLHLVFNMMWLRDLGSMVEDRKGSLFLAIFILTVAGASNFGQYLFSHTYFGGMSGVVYALLGYVWMKGKYDPTSRMGLHKTTVIMMLGWFVLCFTGLMGNIANMAHTVGLVIGVGWGFLTSGQPKRFFDKWKD